MPASTSGPVPDAARILAARRPPGPPAGYQNWRRLLFAHWPISAAVLRPLVPDALSLDEYNGSAYLTLTPFVVEAARPVATPPALGIRFPETNVRTYVHLDGSQPGVYFFSLDAASLLAVMGARLGLGLPYFWATGRERLGRDEVDYTLRRLGCPAARCHVRYRIGEYLGPATPGTLDHFLVERYLLHVQRCSSLWSVQVHHRPYPLYAAKVLHLQDDLVRAAGIAGLGEPALVHFASGVDVEIFPPTVRILPSRQSSTSSPA